MDTPDIQYVATEISHLPSGRAHGEFARIYVNGEWRFDLNVPDNYTGYSQVIMFTRRTDQGTSTVSFNVFPELIHGVVSELATLLPPF